MTKRRISALFGMFCLVASVSAASQNVALTTVKPSKTFSYFPNQDPTPAVTSIVLPGQPASEPVLAFKVESEITYNIPQNQGTFSGILAYQPPRLDIPAGEPPYYTPVLVKITVDGRTVLEQGLNETTPPLQFSISVSGGNRLVIDSKTPYVGNQFYLARGNFSAARDQPFQRFLVGMRQGFVDSAPLPRQRIYGIFQADENVRIGAYFGGAATQASVSLRFTPEHSGANGFANVLNLPLQTMSSGESLGSVVWKVPECFGPGQLEVSEAIAGQTVFSQTFRIAIGPLTDLSQILESDFGVHSSTDGYPLLGDEFAGLWGAKWGRIFLHWDSIEPRSGEYDFSRADALLSLYIAQHMRVLVVVGENAPAWVGEAGPQYVAAWPEYVTQVARHFAGRVAAWDVFNEVDVKYVASTAKGAPADWDLSVLSSGIRALRDVDPKPLIVCCSTGTTQWLLYDKKLLDGGVLPLADVLSLHPYQPGPPEVKDGAFNYMQRIDAVNGLAASSNLHKPVWSTEANWIIGGPGETDTSAPGVTEPEQARYVVRTNLLSTALNVKYFLHSPFGHRRRPQTHLATWAAYAQMAHLFSGVSRPKLVLSGPQIFAVVATTSSGGYVGAAWSVLSGSDLRISNGRETFLDMYGNKVSEDPEETHLSPEPLYFEGSGPAPELTILHQAKNPEWRPVAPARNWTCSRGTTCTTVAGGVHVQSLPAKYAYQLVSPVMSVPADRCQLVHISLSLEKGAIGVFALDAATERMLGRSTFAAWVPDGKPRDMEFRFRSNPSTSSVKLVVGDANFSDSVSSFVLLNRSEIADCP